MLVIDNVQIDPHQIAETGEYDLEGLFIRLRHAIESIGARRVVLDTIETLFSGFANEGLLRSEIRRLFQFLKSFGVTAIITGERGEKTLTRFGLEEYVADCVILLDHRVTDQVSTRRLRVVKYRGSTHGSNEYPFLIDEQGFSVLPLTSMGLQHKVSSGGGQHRHSGPRCDARAQEVSIAAIQCCCRGLRAPARPVFPVRWRARPANAASGRCTSPSKNRPRRSFAT